MSDPAAADMVALGIEAARAGNRLLARLHFERASRQDPVNPLVWLWLAWVADSPSQAELHLRKIQAGPYAEAATAGLKWLAVLSGPVESSVTAANHNASTIAKQASATDSTLEPENGPVYSLKCPGCREHLRIWGKLIGPLHCCPACKAVFVAERDVKNPKRFTRRLLSTESAVSTGTETSLSADSEHPLILVLDNRMTRRQLMMNVLRREGYRVQPAVDRTEALTLAKELQPRLILLDGNLPGLDGLEICRALRSEPATQKTPIVMLSNKTGFFDQVQARLAGCTAYVPKPCEAEVLLRKLQQLIQPSDQSEVELEQCDCPAQRFTFDLDANGSSQADLNMLDPLRQKPDLSGNVRSEHEFVEPREIDQDLSHESIFE